MNKNRIRGLRWRAKRPMTTKPISIKRTGGKSDGLCIEGGRTYLGRSAACYGNVTESGVIHSYLAAEVSRWDSTHESEEVLNERERLVGQGTQEPIAAENPVLSGLLAYYGCVNNTTGASRIVSKATICKSTEHKISWNEVGPRGLQGSKGNQGNPGPQGPRGPQGPTGPQGPREFPWATPA
jgi:hypothetical protein